MIGSTLLLWALAGLLIMLSRWSADGCRRITRREEAGHFWLWEHEPTREVSHE
jgi:hypothetical protein